MWKLLFASVVFFGIVTCGKKAENVEKQVNKQEQVALDEGWTSLFDGTDLSSWRTYGKDSVVGDWEISEGALVYRPHPDSAHGMNNLITKKKYKSFELALEWKIEKDGNSGVFYSILEDEKYVVPYMTAPEIQLRDYSGTPDFSDHKQMSGAIFGIIGPENDVAKPAGQWNQLYIRIDRKNNLGAVTLNGVELFTYSVSGEGWDNLVEASKFKDWEGFAKIEEGHIGLQDHAHEVWFRNIRIREL